MRERPEGCGGSEGCGVGALQTRSRWQFPQAGVPPEKGPGKGLESSKSGCQLLRADRVLHPVLLTLRPAFRRRLCLHLRPLKAAPQRHPAPHISRKWPCAGRGQSSLQTTPVRGPWLPNSPPSPALTSPCTNLALDQLVRILEGSLGLGEGQGQRKGKGRRRGKEVVGGGERRGQGRREGRRVSRGWDEAAALTAGAAPCPPQTPVS